MSRGKSDQRPRPWRPSLACGSPQASWSWARLSNQLSSVQQVVEVEEVVVGDRVLERALVELGRDVAGWQEHAGGHEQVDRAGLGRLDHGDRAAGHEKE